MSNLNVKTNLMYENQDLLETVKLCDSIRLRNLLDQTDETTLPLMKMNLNLLHEVAKIAVNPENQMISSEGKNIIYMLVDAGLDIEVINDKGNTCLFESVRNNNLAFCEVLLQCGADMWANTEMNVSVYEYVMNHMTSDTMKEIFMKFSPGLWKAVESENIYQVRKLVNLWCRTNLKKNGLTLKDIALDTGNEEIISLILGIFDSMELVHHILAKNIKAVSGLLESKRQRVRLDLRKMSDRGAPILYYLIQSQDVPVIRLFVQHGCPLYTIMQDELGFDMPVLFSALEEDLSVYVLEALLPLGKPLQEEMLYKILYRGHSVLDVALQKNVPFEVFNVLIDRGGPLLLCERNQKNETVLDLARSSGKTQYRNIINLNICSWIQQPWKYPGRRQKMALFGWDLTHIEREMKENLYVDEYFNIFKPLQVKVKHLSDSIEKGNYERFIDLNQSIIDSNVQENFLWHGRVVGDGMPLLHKAVLHNRYKMVEMILSLKPQEESIDNLFDQYRRTALHYAYATASTKDITRLLTSYGCSEHVLDKANKEPLDFREKQDSPLMQQLLNRLKTKDCSLEMDPWETNDANSIQEKVSCCHQVIEKSVSNSSEESDSEVSDEEDYQETKTCLVM